jgi:hypothetical protein
MEWLDAFTADEALQKPSVYVAGKGKYCKEISVNGYLDCWRAKSTAILQIIDV